jgi:hypothetical protein
MKTIKIKTTKEIIEEVEIELPIFVKDSYYYYAIFNENEFIRVTLDNYDKSISHFLLNAKFFANNQRISKEEFIQVYNEAKEHIDSININEFVKTNDGE